MLRTTAALKESCSGAECSIPLSFASLLAEGGVGEDASTPESGAKMSQCGSHAGGSCIFEFLHLEGSWAQLGISWAQLGPTLCRVLAPRWAPRPLLGLGSRQPHSRPYGCLSRACAVGNLRACGPTCCNTVALESALSSALAFLTALAAALHLAHEKEEFSKK